jgi:hypothetical protein
MVLSELQKESGVMDLLVRRSVYFVDAEIHDAFNENAVSHGTLLAPSVKKLACICT